MRTSAVVLAGGEGRRMGGPVPKPLVAWRGRPLLAWVLEAVAHADEVLVLHGAPAHAHAVSPLLPRHARLVPDRSEGPLAALAAGARAARGEHVLVAPCDAPLLTRALYDQLLAASAGRDGAAARADGHDQPLVAVYRRAALAAAAEAALDQGRRAARDALERLDAARVDVDAGLLRDADTRDDLAALGHDDADA